MSRRGRSQEAPVATDRAMDVAAFLLSREVKRLGDAAAVQRVIDERWPALTDDEMGRVIRLLGSPLATRRR